MSWTPNRIVAFGGGALAVIAGVVAAAGGIAGPGAAALLGGIGGAAVLAREWLVGWREHEARQGEGDQPVGRDDLEEIMRRLADRPELIREALERVRQERPPA